MGRGFAAFFGFALPATPVSAVSDQCPLTLRHEQRQQWWRMGKTRANDRKRRARRCSLFQFPIVAFSVSFCLSISATKKDMYPAMYPALNAKNVSVLYHLEMVGRWNRDRGVVWPMLGLQGYLLGPLILSALPTTSTLFTTHRCVTRKQTTTRSIHPVTCVNHPGFSWDLDIFPVLFDRTLPPFYSLLLHPSHNAFPQLDLLRSLPPPAAIEHSVFKDFLTSAQEQAAPAPPK